ncbi:MAG: methylated-DNA--[protein]-cysteine S-methyltransferase [Acidimicrobiia bacterium]|nr:methylated-DNA--[protein]-cysteine S-methyltransferase [Acidimicrobiia bacterium]MDH4306925.1 methylated-DNA--[protein]-cysteine S-methyltransferase [Acidimicrobiia bacterium]MDH5520742.1 methylated-DNA--[protein]-cysteine S-methyltransferase [Acidimicrobiia bacterium]
MNLEDALSTLHEQPPAIIESGVLLGTGLVDGFSAFDSPVGQVMVTFNTRGVSSVDLMDLDAPHRFEDRFGRRVVEARTPRGWDSLIARAIEKGTPGDLPLDLRNRTPFQRAILEIAATIPRGEVRPYGWLAKEGGKPGAVRAVGSVMATNPVPLIVPCHRVVRTDGHIGNYSLGGGHNKASLLVEEGADPDLLESLASRNVRFWGSDTTRIYCHPTCRAARTITSGHLIEFRSASQADEAGYRPCKLCRP